MPGTSTYCPPALPKTSCCTVPPLTPQTFPSPALPRCRWSSPGQSDNAQSSLQRQVDFVCGRLADMATPSERWPVCFFLWWHSLVVTQLAPSTMWQP